MVSDQVLNGFTSGILTIALANADNPGELLDKAEKIMIEKKSLLKDGSPDYAAALHDTMVAAACRVIKEKMAENPLTKEGVIAG